MVVSCGLDSRFDKPSVCDYCGSAEAAEGKYCPECAIHLAVDDDECEEAFAIAETYGYTREYVDGVIRECAEYARTIRREMHDAMAVAS